jgi:hypothetical protein
MNDNTDGTRAWRRVWLLICMVGAALLITACGASGGSGSSNSDSNSPATSSTGSAQGTTYQKVLAFSQCMRSHGVLNFPDPNLSGAITMPSGTGAINLDSSQVRTAIVACRHVLPNGGALDPAQQEKYLSALLKFSQCMRSHGVANFPDPALVNGQIALSIKGTGINAKSPQVVTAVKTCTAEVRTAYGVSS